MKRKLRGITVPYHYYNKNKNYTCYIYKDKEYTDLNKLFTDFLGSYLTYHFTIKDKEKEVHNLSDVLEELLSNYKNFDIPSKYKKEYSKEEYSYIIDLKEKLIKNELRSVYDKEEAYKMNLRNTKNHKMCCFIKEMYDKTADYTYPKRVHSNTFNHDYYCVAGNAYESIYHAIDEVYDNNLYYQFGGTKSQNNRSHLHSHCFDDLVSLIFSSSTEFKIHISQQEYYSKQELEFLNNLAEKFKKMKFRSKPQVYNHIDAEEYIYLKDNKKYFSLLINNIRFYRQNHKYEVERLKNHKI